MTMGYKHVAMLPKLSGLVNDQVVNDWYSNTVLDATAVHAILVNFYSLVGTWFSISMAGTMTVNTYAIPDVRPAPGIGFGPPTSTHTGAAYTTGGNGLPAQVACVLSFHADFTGIPEHGPARTRPRATRRGRVYLGELAYSALDTETTGGKEVEFLAAFVNQVSSAASALKSAPGFGWSVFSKKNWALYPVVAGWVDDSPDITRRRKIAPDARTAWS